MNQEQFFLGKLAEECVEVAQRCHKAMQFGLNERQSTEHQSNVERLMDEYADLIGTYRVLQKRGILPPVSVEKLLAKEPRLEKYMKYSQSLGMVDE